MKSKLIIIFSLFLVFNVCSAKEGQINGKIKLKNGAPVSYATVHLNGIKKTVTTDDSGSYIIKNIPYGKYTMQILSIEIENEKVPIEVKQEHTEYSFTVRENKKVNLSEVVVLGNAETRELKNKGFSINVIDTKKAGLQSTQSLELLDRTAGIKIRQDGGLGSHTHFSINGLTGNSVRIFIDGIPIRNYGSSFSLSSIPPALIERIEIYKGVLPSHLSEDALGGGINVVLKKNTRNSFATSISYGSFNTSQLNADGNYRDPKTGLTISGSAFYNNTDNNYKVWGNEVYVSDSYGKISRDITAERFHDGYKSYGIIGKAGFTDVKWADQFMIGMLFSDMQKDIQNGATMEIVYGNRTSSQDTKMANLQYEKRNIVKGLDFSAFASYSQANRTVTDTIPYRFNWLGEIQKHINGSPVSWIKGGGEAGTKTNAQNIEKNIAGRANLSYHINPQNKLSANFLYDRFTRDVDDPMQAEAMRALTDTRYLTKQIISGAYENKLFDDRLKTTLFYKYYLQDVKLKDPKKEGNTYVSSIYNEDISMSGYGGAFAYILHSNILLMLSAEKAYRLPSGDELLGNTSENINSSYDLKPEHSINFNVGANLGDFYLAEIHQFNFDFNVFYRNIKDMIIRGETTATDDNYSFINVGQILSKGVDLEVKYKYAEKLNVLVNASSTDARYNLEFAPNGQRYIYYKDRLRNAPYFTSSCNVEYFWKDFLQKKSRLILNYHLGYVHQFFRNWESLGGAGKATIPTQMVHNLGFSYTFPGYKFTVSFDAKNIFNEQVFDNWALQKPGRSFFGKVSYRIF